MARRRVSKKVHTTEMAPIVEAALPEIAQTSAVFKLPDETFLEILSYFPVINLRYRHTGHMGHRGIWGINVLPGEFIERFDILRAITQTCRTLRRKFLSWLWERVEACVVPTISTWYIYVGNVLQRKCHILLKNPSLATHVRVMSVTVSRYQMDTILPTFVNCLQSLPNLHTLELCHVHQEMTTKLKQVFEGTNIPSIRTIVLPTSAHHILRSCPNVEDVTCNAGGGSEILGTIAASCPKVERVSGTSPSAAMIKRLAKKHPNLREVSFSPYLGKYWDPDISALGVFKRLATIELQLELPAGGDPPARYISPATKVLRASEYGGRKVIKVRALRARQDGASGPPRLEILDIVVA